MECYYCGKEACWETPTNGVYLCDRPDCAYNYVTDQSEAIETEED